MNDQTPATPAMNAGDADGPDVGSAAAPAAASDADSITRRVEQLAAEIEEARATAQLKGEYLATMSHEFRTPMNGMLGMTHLLLQSDLTPDQRSLVEVIQTSARSLLTLINDTLDFSRLESGKLEIESLDFDLRVTVEQVAALLAPMANEKGLHFDCRVSHEVPSRLNGDPQRIRQVLLNLAGNAIKFTDHGHVTIAVERIIEDEASVSLQFKISDTGIGMSPDQLGHLFESFMQADPSIARRYGGTGLGLSISRRLVGLMGGEVGVESMPGQGSTFRFLLTLAKQSAAEAVTPAGAPASNATHRAAAEARESLTRLVGVRVLVVDSLSGVRNSLLEMLRGWGCVADAVANGADALTMLRDAAAAARAYRIAIVDLELPDLGGEALARSVRAEEALERTLLMLLTNVGRQGDAAWAQELGFSAYLLKPVEPDQLRDALVEVVRRSVDNACGGLITRHSLAEAQRGRVSVLLVEDEPVNQLVARSALERLGYSVQTVVNGAAALEAYEDRRYDVILLDLQLPDLDGDQVAIEIRNRERALNGHHTPIVAMTGHARPEDRERCLAAGMDDYIVKPVDLDLMCSVIEHLTRQSQVARMAESRQMRPPDAVAASLPTPSTASAADPGARSSSDSSRARASGPSRTAALTSLRPPLDLERLNQSCIGMPTLRQTLLETFISEVRPRFNRLRFAVNASDARLTEFEAHGLKGMCATVGARICAELFDQLEHAGHSADFESAQRVLPEVERELTRTEHYVERFERALQRAA